MDLPTPLDVAAHLNAAETFQVSVCTVPTERLGVFVKIKGHGPTGLRTERSSDIQLVIGEQTRALTPRGDYAGALIILPRPPEGEQLTFRLARAS